MAGTLASYPVQYEVHTDLPAYETNDGEAAPSYGGDFQDASTEAVHETEHSLNAEEEVIRVGNKFTLSLVTPRQLLDHLLLLSAFHQLKLDVMDASSAYYTEYAGLAGEGARGKAWQVFVRRAVHRFEIWLQKIANQSGTSSLSSEESTKHTTSLVPLDIVMVWHSYVVNPLEYYEDEVRGRVALKLKAFPLGEIVRTIDKETKRPRHVKIQDKDTFQRTTGISYDPPLATNSSEVLHVPCPGCEEVVWNVVHWLNKEGTGYAQQSFATNCRVCDLQFTRESMGVRKLTNEIALWKDQRNRHCLAGTRLNSYTGAPWKEASKLTQALVAPMLSSSKFRSVDLTPASMAKVLKFSHSEVDYHFRQSVMGSEGLRTDIGTPPRVQRILSAYTNSSPLSVDLVEAVNVQQEFIEAIGKVCEFREITEMGADVLVTAIARYCAYWDLLVEQPTKCRVPSLDIVRHTEFYTYDNVLISSLQDLCLHTHQLHWSRYRHTSLELLSRIPDHDSFCNPDEFSKALRTTSVVWKDRYGVPYSQMDIDSPTKVPRIFARMLHSRKASKTKGQVKESLLWDSAELQPFTAPSTHFQCKKEAPTVVSGRARYNEAPMPLRPLEPLHVPDLYSPDGDTYSAYWGVVRRAFDENGPWSGYRPNGGV